MDIKYQTTINLKPSDIEQILTESLKKEFPGQEIKNINYNVSNTADDRFGGDGTNYELTGIDIVMVPKSGRVQR